MSAAKKPGSNPSTDSDTLFPHRGSVIGLVIGIVLLQTVVAGAVYLALGSWSDRAAFGDMFGVANTLFSGLALAGVVYAILLQRRELALQRRELTLTREELRRTADAQAASNKFRSEELRVLKAQLAESQAASTRDLTPVLVSTGVTRADDRYLVTFRNVGGAMRDVHVSSMPAGASIRVDPSTHIDRNEEGRLTIFLTDDSERVLKFRIGCTNERGTDIVMDAECDPWREMLRATARKDDCYLTTACVEHFGLPDDCRELTLMRTFRDEFLMSYDLGFEIVVDYYVTAPHIVQAIKRSPNRAQVMETMLADIRETVGAYERGEPMKAVKLYLSMVSRVECAVGQLDVRL